MGAAEDPALRSTQEGRSLSWPIRPDGLTNVKSAAITGATTLVVVPVISTDSTRSSPIAVIPSDSSMARTDWGGSSLVTAMRRAGGGRPGRLLRVGPRVAQVTTRYVVYVPNSSQANLLRGLEALVWGWEDSVLDRGGFRRTAEAMRAGDLLVLASGGGDPRNLSDDRFAARGVGTACLLRVKDRVYRSAARVWDDEDRLYPNRVDFEFMERGANWGLSQLGRDALFGLRLSANNRGAPIAVGTDFLPHELETLAQAGPAALGHIGEYDAYAQILIRREQTRLRDLKVGRAETVHCNICGRTLPNQLLRAAHIKRRADCTAAERDNLANVLVACTLGCDDLFEHGYIGISDDLKVIARAHLTGDVLETVRELEGRAVTGIDAGSIGFIRAHRQRHSTDARTIGGIGA